MIKLTTEVMITDPVFSVVMPHWNASDVVVNAINSIRNQSMDDWELIIVDDGSDILHKDNLELIVKRFGDFRIRLEGFSYNQGIVAARNYGCQLAKGEIIVTQDADDLSMPDRLKKCLSRLNYFSADVLYHGAYLNMWDKQFECISRKYLPAYGFINKELLQGQCTNGWYVFRKSVWKKKPFRMETQYAYDYMAILDWAYSDFRIENLDEGLYEYVRHENSASITFEKDGRRQKSIEAIRKIMKEEYGQTLDVGGNAGL